MNNYRLLIILLVGMLLSACARFTPYRPVTPSESADSKQQVHEWRAECGVDDVGVRAAQKKGHKLKLCEDRNSTDSHALSPAIQHRFYQTKDRQEGDYYLSFVEFDDQGWFADRRQMEELFALLKKLEDDKESNGETLIYVYTHGWKHNASSCDDNVVCFSRLLERTDLAEKGAQALKGLLKPEIDTKVKPRKVVGIYLGWRGLPFDGVLNNLSFWTRKDTAARVGRGGVFELLTRLNDYRDSRQVGKVVDTSKTQLVITGHSFGGLVIYSALSHALMERAARTTTKSNGTQYKLAKSFGDFVMLVNPAFEGSLYEPLFHIATSRCYEEKQQPVMMIVTSEADSATGKAFPMGRTLGTLFQHAKSPEQADSIRKTIGHNPRYQTHNLIWKEPEEKKQKLKVAKADKTEEAEVDKPECDCPHLTATSRLSLEDLLGPYYDQIIGINPFSKDKPDPKSRYGKGVSLKTVKETEPSSPSYTFNYPYLVVNTSEEMIPDHNAIYNDRFILFTQMFFIDHIEDSKPWTVQSDSVPACWTEKEAPGSLVPIEWSCQLDDTGKSCASQTLTN